MDICVLCQLPSAASESNDWATILQALGALVAVPALLWAVWQHKSSIVLQRRLRSEETLLQIALTWNGAELLKARLAAEPWLARFPEDENPRDWIERQEPGAWLHYSILAHFLVNAEYLTQRGVLESNSIYPHIGGGAWWARELVSLYAAIGPERRVVSALWSFLERYPRLEFEKVNKLPLPPRQAKQRLQFNSQDWTGR